MDGSYFTTCSEGKFYMQMSYNPGEEVFSYMLESGAMALIDRIFHARCDWTHRQYVSGPSGPRGAAPLGSSKFTLWQSEP